MAELEFVASGEVDALDAVRSNWNISGNFVVKLFTATTDPDHDSATASDFTEATFSGYSAATVTDFSTPVHVDNTQHAVTSPSSDPTFMNSESFGVNVKGVFIVDSGSGDLLCWGYFLSGGTDITIPASSTLNVALSVNLKTLFEH